MNDLPISIALIALIAAASPPLASLIGRVVKVPLVVFEIALGIAVGPDVLGWVKPNSFIETLSQFGLAMLFFMAGNEINFKAISGRPVQRAGWAWVISLGAGIAAGLLLGPTVEAGILIGIAVSSTSLGTLLPILRDAGETKTVFGRAVTAVGTIGEFGPLLAISLFLSGRSFGVSAVLLVVFVGIVGLSIWLASRGNHHHAHKLTTVTLNSSGQFGVRLVLLIIAVAVALSTVFGLDMLLGAFAAGILWRVFMGRAAPPAVAAVESKLDAVAFGFLVPFFFVNTGVAFDLKALFDNAYTLALVPIFLVLLLVVRGVPNILAAPEGASWGDRRAIVLFGATGLPIIVAVTAIGKASGFLPSGIATALVGAGMLSVLLFPALALTQHQKGSQRRTPKPEQDTTTE